ncbi:MAG: hypothetical protein ABH846_03845 [Patescibacteria group bacterium]
MPEDLPESIQNLSFATWDTLAIAIILVLVFVYAYTIGKDYVATMIFGLYIAAGLVTFAPHLAYFYINIGIAPHFLKLILLLIALVVVMFIISMNGYFEPYIVPSSWEVPVFCILFAGLLITIAASYLPVETIDSLAPSTRMLFANETGATIWVLAPILGMLIIKGRD